MPDYSRGGQITARREPNLVNQVAKRTDNQIDSKKTPDNQADNETENQTENHVGRQGGQQIDLAAACKAALRTDPQLCREPGRKTSREIAQALQIAAFTKYSETGII